MDICWYCLHNTSQHKTVCRKLPGGAGSGIRQLGSAGPGSVMAYYSLTVKTIEVVKRKREKKNTKDKNRKGGQ
jgi:hypothetical protein